MPDIWFDGLTLRRWDLHNFKSVRDASVELAPLTIIVGANSAGKSTLLQSIRAAAQASVAVSAAFPLNGEQLRLGTYEETRWVGAAEDDREIGLGGCFVMGSDNDFHTFAPTRARRRYRPARRLEHEGRVEWSLRLQGAPAGQPASTNIVEIRVGTQIDGADSGRLHAVSGTVHRKPFTFGHESAYTGSIIEETGESSDIVDLEIRGGFPQRALHRQSLASTLVWSWYRAQQASVTTAMRSGKEPATQLPNDELVALIADDLEHAVSDIGADVVTDFREERRIVFALRERFASRAPVATSWTPEVLDEAEAAVGAVIGADVEAAREIELPEPVREFSDRVQYFLSTNVQHLGPLRFDPQVVYTTAPVASPGFIGAKGEYCAAVLQASGQNHVDVPLPGLFGSRRVALATAVNKWAAALGIGDSFVTTDEGRLGLQLSTRQSGLNLDLDLTSVGTGVSQLLPVLVMCLQAPQGSLLLIEQPELHLNPGVQQRLADFLLAIAGSGRQLIVETHSDYLISRLRRRTVEDETDGIGDRIALVFAERSGATTTYRTVRPADDGSMATWPAGFFDEAAIESESILRALVARRRKRHNPR